MNKNMLKMQKAINTFTGTWNSTSTSTIQVVPSSTSQPQNLDEYDGIFTSPLTGEIHNFPLPPKHNTPKFKMFSVEKDPK